MLGFVSEGICIHVCILWNLKADFQGLYVSLFEVLNPLICYDLRRRDDRYINIELFENFKLSLAEHDLKCGWVLQLTPAPSKPKDNEHDIQL